MARADRPFEAEFRPLESRQALLSGLARIRLLLGDKDEESGGEVLPPKQGEAYRIARMIRDAVEGKTLPVWREGRERPAEYDDFAILLRSTGSQGYYERFFRVFGIPYEVQDLRSFYLEAPVNDFYVLLETVVYPSDRLAYAALLRSPWVGLSDDSLSALLLASLEPFDPAGLDLMVRQEDRDAYLRGSSLYLWCREQADTLPLPELLEELWFRRGYRYTLLREPLYHSYLEYFDYLWTLAAEAENRGLSLAGFLDGLRVNLGQFERLKELKVEKKHQPGVKIMTIHGSKGLEFPVTIIGDAGSRGRKGQEGAAPFFFTPAWGITLKLREGKGANPFYEAAREERQAQEDAELKRLLYVALTRSENHLIMAGTLPGDKIESQDSLLNLFLQGFGITRAEEIPLCLPLAPYLTWMEPVLRSDAGVSGQYRGRRDPAEASRLYSLMPLGEKKFPRREWGVTEWIRDREDHRSEQPRGEQLPPLGCDPLLEEYQWEASFGTLCHLCLEEKLKGWAVPGRREALLRELPREDRDRVLKEAESVTARFFASPLGREVARAVKIEPEYPFLLRRMTPQGPRILRGTMDLLVLFQDQVWVVDFKTDRFREPWFHREQLEIYRHAAEALTGESCRSFLFYLRDGSVEEINNNSNFGEGTV
jgi:ATP-dependent helicase/nuclease subunit A